MHSDDKEIVVHSDDKEIVVHSDDKEIVVHSDDFSRSYVTQRGFAFWLANDDKPNRLAKENESEIGGWLEKIKKHVEQGTLCLSDAKNKRARLPKGYFQADALIAGNDLLSFVNETLNYNFPTERELFRNIGSLDVAYHLYLEVRKINLKKTNPKLLRLVIISMGLDPMAIEVGKGVKRKIYKECKKQYPEKFRMSFTSFRTTWKIAVAKGLIKTIKINPPCSE